MKNYSDFLEAAAGGFKINLSMQQAVKNSEDKISAGEIEYISLYYISLL